MICDKQVTTSSKNIFQPFQTESSIRKLCLEWKLLPWFLLSTMSWCSSLYDGTLSLTLVWLESKNTSPVFKFSVDQGLLDLRGTWTVKSELWACESAFSSPSYLYYLVKCINIAACYKIHPKRLSSLDKAWKNSGYRKWGTMQKKSEISRKLWTYADKLINFPIKRKRPLVDTYG